MTLERPLEAPLRASPWAGALRVLFPDEGTEDDMIGKIQGEEERKLKNCREYEGKIQKELENGAIKSHLGFMGSSERHTKRFNRCDTC